MVEALLRQMSRRADLSDFDSPFTRYGGRSSNTLLIRNNPATGKEASEVFADLHGQNMPSFMARFCRTFSIKRARSCHFVTDRLGLGALPICEKYRGSCLCIIEFRLHGLTPGEALVVVARGDHQIVDSRGHAGRGSAAVSVGLDR
jgi:hypothetical protein